MSKRWFQPSTGIKKVSEDSPGDGWLTIVTMTMPDGQEIDSTLEDLDNWLKTSPDGYVSHLSNNILEISGDASRVGANLIPSIEACRYYRTEMFQDDGYEAWFVTYDYDATPYEGERIEVFDDDEKDPDQADISGGGGGRGGPPPPKPPPWNNETPFPDIGPKPGAPVLPEPTEPEPDQDTPIEDLAKEQADADIGMVPDPDGDIEHPDGAPSDKPGDMPGGKGPCSDCNGTGQKPDDGDGQDGGEEESDDGGDGGDGDDEDGDGSPDGSECGTCGGSGEMPQDQDDGDEPSDDEGLDDDQLPEDDESIPDDPYDPQPVVEAANRAIEAANRAIATDDPEQRSRAVQECFEAVQDCQQKVDHRSTTQRQVLQRALDAAQAALGVSA